MLTMKKLIAAVTACLLAVAVEPALVSANTPGKLNIKATGPDGKRVEDPYIIETEMGVKPANQFGVEPPRVGKGRVVTVSVTDGKGNFRQSVLYVPDGTKVDMVMPLKPGVLPETGAATAKNTKERGDTKGYEEAYNAIKDSRDQMQRVVREGEDAVDDWAKDNGLRKQSLEEINKQLKAADKLVAKGVTDPEAVEKLKAYKEKLLSMQIFRDYLKAYNDLLASLEPPEKKVTVLPSTCPEGQSGGLLAGLLNSATGTNSFTGICDDKEKQNKNKDHQNERKGNDHEDE